jgi:mannitol 2-dehydrogenase
LDALGEIGVDLSARGRRRAGPTIERELELGGPIECAALALAGWARYLAVTPPAERAPDPRGQRTIALALASLDAPLTFLALDEVFSPPLRESERFRQAFSEASRSLAADGSFGALDRLLA